MATPEVLPFSVVLPGEQEVDQRNFDAMPVRAIARYLEHFDDEACQRIAVPQHLLEALAKRLVLPLASRGTGVSSP